MDAVAYLIRDILVWTFETVLEPLGDLPNLLFLIMLFVGLFTWLRMQAKYNAEADANPNQIK